jgi:kynurenine formamidase
MIRAAVRYIELSHTIGDGMAVFPGLKRPRVTAFLDHERSRLLYEGEAEFYISKVELVGNTATYLDSPFHRHREGRDLSEISLEDVAGVPGIVLHGEVDADRAGWLDADESQLAGQAVLVRTGWDARWGTDAYWEPGPYIAPAALDLLLRARPKLVGVDFWNVDDTSDPSRRVHTRLLAEQILIVEHLCNLGALPKTSFRFYAVPLRIVTGASFPVRAFAELARD